MKNSLARALVVLLLAGLTVVYLHPGLTPVWNGELDRAMSDGTDAATLPYMYGALHETFLERPSDLFYGAVPARHLNAPEGFALWIPWSERILALAATAFVPLEHVSTVYAALLMFLNGLCMYALGRALGWSRGLAFSLAVAWAFCPFTRARAQVHAGFAGTYHVPLALLSVLWALRGRTWRSLAASSAGFLAVAMAPHYFVITLAFVSPFLLAIGYLASADVEDPSESETKFSVHRATGRLATAVTPMILLLGWCYFMPLPADLLATVASPLPPSGKTVDGRPHPFLERFAAHPVDYLTGDVALGDSDWNPLRSALTREVRATLGASNAHERANGVRWVIWLLVLAGLTHWPQGKRPLQISILLLGLFGFWLSLPPPGPSQWLYSLVSQIRVPSRAGIYVHFAALLFAGGFLHSWCDVNRRRRWVIWALPFLVIADLPPFLQNMMISKLRPALSSFGGHRECGAGMYYPYVAGNRGILESYHFLQELRGTRCDVVNRQWPDESSEKMYHAMGLNQAVLDAFNAQDPKAFGKLIQFARCAPLSFLVFDPRAETAARAALCRQLGWTMSEARVCRRPPLPLIENPARCL